MLSSKLYIPFLSVLLLTLTACESYSSHQGTVGNYYTIQIEKPVGVENPSYGWDILSFPDESMLTYSDLYIRQEGREMAFKPDVPGDYEFEFIVFNNTGEAVVTNEYLFKISSSAMAEISVGSRLAETEEVEETVTAKELSTPEPPAKKITSPPPTSAAKNWASMPIFRKYILKKQMNCGTGFGLVPLIHGLRQRKQQLKSKQRLVSFLG